MSEKERVYLVNLIMQYGLNNRLIGLDPLDDNLYSIDEKLLSEILDCLLS